VDIGVAFFPTDLGIDIAPLARMVEERPLYALFVAEHTHIPVSRETPHPSGAVLPPQYSHTLDPFVALSNAAAVTERIKLGTGVCLVIERDPIVTANEVASLDRLSGGRFLFGVGAGWNREEMRNHGTDAKRRFSVMRERVEAMKEIWTKDEAEYHGEFVDFDPIWSWPKPTQKPHPPVLLGGSGPKVLDRVLAYADEWTPNRFGSPDELKARIDELRERAGRHVRVVASGVKPDRDLVQRLEQAGADACTLYVSPDADAAQAERELDDFAALH
jgi:probable F420-dependent oxidoreductase